METKETFLPYGVVTGLVLVVLNAVLIATDWQMKPGVSWLPTIPFIAGLILNAIAFSKANNGHITYGKAYMSCFKATCVIAVIGMIWAIVARYAFPDMNDKLLEMARQKIDAIPNATEEQKETGLKVSQAMIKFGFLVVLIGNLIGGAIYSLIAAAIAKKKPYMPEAVQDNNTFGGGAKY